MIGPYRRPAVNQEVLAAAIEVVAVRVSVAISRIMAWLPVVVGFHLRACTAIRIPDVPAWVGPDAR